MSSMVSRSPPPAGSTSQSKDFFWISMRLGTSRTLSSRAKLRRVGGGSTQAKTATPHRGAGGGSVNRSQDSDSSWGGSEDERAALESPTTHEARPARVAQGVPDPLRR